MAVVRLIALAALVGCNASEAGPTRLTPPAGWTALPDLATAARGAAKQANITVDEVEAYGEPARGCYAAWLGVRGGAGAPAALADSLIASLSPDVPGLTLSDVVKPAAKTEPGVLSLAFTRPPYRGRVRATIAKTGSMGVVACFWNLREPAACDATCNALIGSTK